MVRGSKKKIALISSIGGFLAICALLFYTYGLSKVEASSTGPVGYYGQMQTKGNRIVGSKTGNAMQVKGMSFFWSNWSQKFWNASTVEKMAKEFNCEIVRAAYGVTDNGTAYDSSDKERVRQVVKAAIDQNIYVIIDWHSHGAHNNTAEAKAFFTEMAKEFGSYDNVIFEVYNEPTSVSWDTVKSYAEEIIPAIRTYSDNLIVVGSPTWSQDVNSAADNPINAQNIAYSLHFYAGTHTQYLRDKADYALNKGIALFVTEWGSVNADGNGSIAYDSTEEWLNWMDKNQISWCNWAINDKDESSSIYNQDGSFREAGKYLSSILEKQAKVAEWRNGKLDQATATPNPTTAVTTQPTTDVTVQPTNSVVDTSKDDTINVKTTVNSWNSGYVMYIDLENKTKSTVDNWKLVVKASDFKDASMWNVEVKKQGENLIITPMSWNKSIETKSSQSFGMQANGVANEKFEYTLTYSINGVEHELKRN